MESISIKACYMMLQPVIKILLRLGVSFKTFSAIAQKVYIDAVISDDKAEVTASTVSALTGISRKRVGKIMEVDTEALSEPTDKLAVAIVIDNWWEHLDANGLPIHLPIASEDGLDVKQLVASAKLDIPFSTVLKQLKKSHQIHIDNDGLFYPISRNNSSDQFLSFGSIIDGASTVYALANTVYKNAFEGHGESKEVLFERRARVPHMSDDDFAKFQIYFNSQLPILIEQFNDWLESSVAEHKITASPNQGFTGVGIYTFHYSEIEI